MSIVQPALGSIVDAIGATPAVWLDRLAEGLPGRVLLKLESMNPGGSIKDRAALQCLRDAERDGRLRPGMVVVELTSGNMGIGLAVACSIMGYRMIAVMSSFAGFFFAVSASAFFRRSALKRIAARAGR